MPGDGTVETGRETRLEEQHDFAEGDFYRFEPGKAWSVDRATDGFMSDSDAEVVVSPFYSSS